MHRTYAHLPAPIQAACACLPAVMRNHGDEPDGYVIHEGELRPVIESNQKGQMWAWITPDDARFVPASRVLCLAGAVEAASAERVEMVERETGEPLGTVQGALSPADARRLCVDLARLFGSAYRFRAVPDGVQTPVPMDADAAWIKAAAVHAERSSASIREHIRRQDALLEDILFGTGTGAQSGDAPASATEPRRDGPGDTGSAGSVDSVAASGRVAAHV